MKDRAVITIGPQATVADAVAELVHANIGSLPVVDGGRLVGIFTERDVLRGLQNQGKEFCHASIGTVMTRDPVTCQPGESVHEAMGKMSDRAIGQLPVVDGYAATRRIKADPALTHIPIIAVTSYALAGDEAKTRAAGCSGYVAKPFSPRHLLKTVQSFLS